MLKVFFFLTDLVLPQHTVVGDTFVCILTRWIEQVELLLFRLCMCCIQAFRTRISECLSSISAALSMEPACLPYRSTRSKRLALSPHNEAQPT